MALKYFIRKIEPGMTEEEKMAMFYTNDREGYKQAAPGIRMKTLVYGEKTLLAEFRMAQSSHLPRHAHPQE